MSDLEKRVEQLETRMSLMEDLLDIQPPVIEPPVIEPPVAAPPPTGKPAGWKEGDRIIYFGTGRGDHNIRYDFDDGDRSGNMDTTCAAGTTNWYYFDIPELGKLVDGDTLGFRHSVVNHAVRNSGMFYGSVSFQQGDEEIQQACCGYEISTTASTSKNNIDFAKPFYWKIHQKANPKNIAGGFRFTWGIYTYWKKDYQ